MKKILFFVIYTFTFSGFSQEDAWVFFNAKPNAQAFFDNPLAELSQRSLNRRITQNITLDSKDAPLHQAYVDQITTATGISVLAKSKWLNALHIRGTQTNILALKNLSFVDHIQFANHSLNAKMASNTSTTLVNKWQDMMVDYNYGNSETQVKMLNAHVLHQQNYTGEGKIIAVIDSGFQGVDTQPAFKRLRDNGQILGGYDFVHDSSNPYTSHNHGTMVLSTMGGFDANLVGTAPNAQYYLYISEDVGSETPLEESNWIEAAEMADKVGADVINTSLGYFDYDNSAYSYTYAQLNGTTSVISRAANIAFSRGMITVTSAGNSGGTSNPYIGVPGDASLTFTVGAVDASKVKASFSSIGPSADGRIKPDVMAMGKSSIVANQSGAITAANGTSFSSPILAGAITSFWSAFPNKKNSEIIQYIKESADRFTSPDNNYGYGIPDFQKALNNILGNSGTIDDQVIKPVNFNLFLDPSTNETVITSPKNLFGKILKLYNNIGQEVLEKRIEVQTERLLLSYLSSGVYYYRLDTDDNTIIGKYIIK